MESSTHSRTLYLADLDPHWDEASLLALFHNQGVGGLVQAKIIRDKSTGAPMGYGFLEFEHHDNAKVVLDTFQGKEVPNYPGKIFRINWGERKGAGGELSLFVGDLASVVTDGALLEDFKEKYSSCTGARVVTDHNTGASLGYGFVRFSDETELQQAADTMTGHVLGGRAIRVARAQDRKPNHHHSSSSSSLNHSNHHIHIHPHTRHYSSASNSSPNIPHHHHTTLYPPHHLVHTSSSASSGNGNGNGNASRVSASPPPMFASYPYPVYSYPPHPAGGGYPSQEVPQSNPVPDETNTTVFVGNLDPHVTDEMLNTAFTKYGQVVHTRIPPNRHIGFVTMATHEQAAAALHGLDGTIVSTRPLRCAWGNKTTKPSPTTLPPHPHHIANHIPVAIQPVYYVDPYYPPQNQHYHTTPHPPQYVAAPYDGYVVPHWVPYYPQQPYPTAPYYGPPPHEYPRMYDPRTAHNGYYQSQASGSGGYEDSPQQRPLTPSSPTPIAYTGQ